MIKGPIPDAYFNVYDCGWFISLSRQRSRECLAFVRVWVDEDGNFHADAVDEALNLEPASPPQTCC